MDCHSLLQRIFSTQGSNPGLLHCRRILYHLSHQGVWLPPNLAASLCMKTPVPVTLTRPGPHIAPVGNSGWPCHTPGMHASRTDRPEVGGTPPNTGQKDSQVLLVFGRKLVPHGEFCSSSPRVKLSPSCRRVYTLPLIYFCCSIIQSGPTLCDPMESSTPGFPVLHHRPEFAQTHIY